MVTKKSDFENTEQKYCLIGAGPAGLATARNFQKYGIDFDGFEMHGNVGGLWDIDNPHSSMYESAHLISSKLMTEFTEFPMKASVPDFPSHRDVYDYFIEFAKHFSLNEHFYFNTKVVSVKPKGSKWNVQVQAVDPKTHEVLGKPVSLQYEGVVIANGQLSTPNMPDFPGKFTGEVLHARWYRDPDLFRDKRVLIIGAGNSGCDIVIDAIHRAKHVDMSVRRGYHFVPKYIFGRPADAVGGKLSSLLPKKVKLGLERRVLKMFTGDPVYFGFPEPDHELYESHPIVNSLVLHHVGHGDVRVRKNVERFDGKSVHFVDGSSDEYDLVLYATGYKLDFPFIDRELLNWQGAAPQMYMNCFHPEYDNLFIAGLVEASGLGWQGRYEQAELIAKYIANLRRKTPQGMALKAIKTPPFEDMRGGMNYIKLDRMAYYVHKETYRNQVNQHIKELA